MLSERCCNSAFNTVKPDTNNNLNSAYYVIQKNKKDCINCTESTVDTEPTPIQCIDGYSPKTQTITKPDEAYKVMSSGKHLEQLNKACTENDQFYVPYSVKKAPFAGFN